MEIKPRLIIGLGNPGKEYERTYHNVGFLAVDYLKHDPKLPARLAFGNSKAGGRTHLNLQIMKSTTYMNNSGLFVLKALKKYHVKPEEILIIHDDSDIELGKYKVSFGRGSAGHRGVESIIQSLNTKNFRRLRIGIRKDISVNQPPHQYKSAILRRRASEIVLKKIKKADWEILEKVFQKISNEIV